MTALVAIEVTTLEREQTQWVAQMLEACSAALRSGACVYAVNEPPNVPRAHVAWHDETAVTISYYDGVAPNSEPVQRVLHFTEADAPQEKWRTVGFTTALLAGGREETPAPVAAQPRLEASVFSTAVTARLIAATGLNLQSPKGGAQVRFEGRTWQAPWLVGVSLEYTADPWQLPGVEGIASWTDVGVGSALLLRPMGEVQLFTRLDVLARRLLVDGEKKDKADTVSIWQPGARLGVDLAWPLLPEDESGLASWWLVFGAHATIAGSPVEVQVEGKPALHVPAVSAGAGLGVSYRR